MSPLAAKPVLHGRDHCHGGADPIPCLPPSPAGGSYESVILAEPSLVAYWPLDEASGDAIDHSGHGYDFRNPTDFVGSVTQATAAGPIAGQTAYGFGGGRLVSQDASHLDAQPVGGGNVTFEAWIYPTAFPSSGAILGFVAQVAGAYQVSLRSGHNVFWDIAGTTQLDSAPAAININEWTHLVAVASSGAPMKMYWNGALIATGTTQAVPDTLESLILGSGVLAGTFKPFTGLLAHVAVYSAVLDAGQISNHYGGTSGADPGSVLTVDDDGHMVWAAPPGAAVPDPADDPKVWMPLTTVVSSVPELVWDANNSLIPTLTPI